jgi:(p)ppGpp synthase/HD superfamily hydrolase
MSMHDEETPDGPLFSPLLETAVRLAARGHHNQFRKSAEQPVVIDTGGSVSDRLPYVAHLMGTMCILARLGVRDEVLAAAVLHDYLEDVPDPHGRDSIRRHLGDEVLSLVDEVTERKRRSLDGASTWDVRKREQIDHVAQMPLDAVLIKAADVLHNMLSLIADLEAVENNDAVWQTFNAGVEQQLWYFASVVEAIRDRLGKDHPLTTELERTESQLRRLAKA